MSRIASTWKRLLSGSWFVPGLLTFIAIVLFLVTHQIDRLLDARRSERPLIFSEGAHHPAVIYTPARGRAHRARIGR